MEAESRLLFPACSTGANKNREPIIHAPEQRELYWRSNRKYNDQVRQNLKWGIQNPLLPILLLMIFEIKAQKEPACTEMTGLVSLRLLPLGRHSFSLNTMPALSSVHSSRLSFYNHRKVCFENNSSDLLTCSMHAHYPQESRKSDLPTVRSLLRGKSKLVFVKWFVLLDW